MRLTSDRLYLTDESAPCHDWELRENDRNLIADLRAHQSKRRDVLILTTRGAKSGQIRENPVVYTRDSGKYVIVASKGGAPTNPAWYHNLRAYPEVTVEVGDDTFEAQARVVDGEQEYERLFHHHASINPIFKEYRSRTNRRIPVVVLERVR